MCQLENTTEKSNQNIIDRIARTMEQNIIVIPKSVLKRKDVSMEARMLFSFILTETLVCYGKCSTDIIRGIMADRISGMSSDEIQAESCCGSDKNKITLMRRQVLRLVLQTDLDECIRERSGSR